MALDIQFLGAAEEVTGSCYLIRCGKYNVLVDCGFFQGSREDEAKNEEPFPFEVGSISAVILTHAHLDHCGRLPLLIKRGYKGPVYAHHATRDVCDVMFQDAAHINEKDAEWENKRRRKKKKPLLEPLYTKKDADNTMDFFKTTGYGVKKKINEAISFEFNDAGHILGSCNVSLFLEAEGQSRTVVFSGDIGHHQSPVLPDYVHPKTADVVVMETTYGNRDHRDWAATWEELGEIFNKARNDKGNILIPAFALGRTQQLLYMMNMNYEKWHLDKWQIFLDSPMAIRLTDIYDNHKDLFDCRYDEELTFPDTPFELPNLQSLLSADDSMTLNNVTSGAIIIAGSGMCSGGRIRHHIKHNISRKGAHLLIVGYQARGTLGRVLVEGAQSIKLWGQSYPVRATLHTVGGLSAHAGQSGLMNWVNGFKGSPNVILTHGEPSAIEAFQERMLSERNINFHVPAVGQRFSLTRQALTSAEM